MRPWFGGIRLVRDVMRFGGLLVAGVMILSTACAQTTRPDAVSRAEEREYRKQDWANRFVDYQERCYHAGGRMVIRASSRLPRSGIPRRGDFYSCTTRIGTLPRH